MNKKGIDLLKNWKPTLLEIVIIAGTLVSDVTTGVGAYAYVNQNLLVALVFTLFVQGSMFAIGHYLCSGAHNPNNDDRKRRRTLLLMLTWVFFAGFSVYFSALGLFQIQHHSLKQNQARSSLIDQWNHAASEIGSFKTSAMTTVTQLKQSTTVEMKLEQGRARQARIDHRPYSPEALQRLAGQLNALNTAETKLRDLKLLSVVPPEDSDEARRVLDQAYSSAKEAYAALPDQVRVRLTEPQPITVAEVSEHIQEAFWYELKARSATVLAISVLALLLDVLPLQLRFAATPRRRLDERMLDSRLWIARMKQAVHVPLNSQTEVVRVTVEGLPQLDIRMNVRAAKGGPLVNVDRDFAQVEAEVRRERGCDIQLASITTVSGRPLADNRPLLAQLGDQRELVLKYVPIFDAYNEPFPEEVN